MKEHNYDNLVLYSNYQVDLNQSQAEYCYTS